MIFPKKALIYSFSVSVGSYLKNCIYSVLDDIPKKSLDLWTQSIHGIVV